MKKIRYFLLFNVLGTALNAMQADYKIIKKETAYNGSIWVHYQVCKEGTAHYCCHCIKGPCKGAEHSHSYNGKGRDFWSELNITCDELEELYNKQQENH